VIARGHAQIGRHQFVVSRSAAAAVHTAMRNACFSA
jgi:hypothetical protein